MGKYDEVKVGDQFERPRLHAHGLEVAMVTHIWDDPVEQKTYVGMAHIRRDGSIDRPTMKHTKRGIGTNRWKPASRDWVAWAKTVKEGNVIALSNPLKSLWSFSRDLVWASPSHQIQDPDRRLMEYDGEPVGIIERKVSTWHWQTYAPKFHGSAPTEEAAIRDFVAAFESAL